VFSASTAAGALADDDFGTSLGSTVPATTVINEIAGNSLERPDWRLTGSGAISRGATGTPCAGGADFTAPVFNASTAAGALADDDFGTSLGSTVPATTVINEISGNSLERADWRLTGSGAMSRGVTGTPCAGGADSAGGADCTSGLLGNSRALSAKWIPSPSGAFFAAAAFDTSSAEDAITENVLRSVLETTSSATAVIKEESGNGMGRVGSTPLIDSVVAARGNTGKPCSTVTGCVTGSPTTRGALDATAEFFANGTSTPALAFSIPRNSIDARSARGALAARIDSISLMA
jgi:hypothetical protein